MGFNAGGANVQGVAAIEQGTLATTSTNTTFSVAGGESNQVTLTVPAGHKYILKNISVSPGNFSGTLSRIILGLSADGSNYVNLYDISGSGTSANLNLPQQITLAAGQKIRWYATSTAWTSGQLNLYACYQDVII